MFPNTKHKENACLLAKTSEEIEFCNHLKNDCCDEHNCRWSNSL